MNSLIQYLFAPGIIITLALTVLFSYKSRRSTDAKTRGLNASRMNISMGAMLVFIAGVQLFLSNESTARIVIGSVFLVLGLFNLFAGFRNHSIYRTMQQ
ncbi:YtpI family protein [Paenibacillus sp. NPDC058071]|uniref:YtpI family protein n=1 Tax=Paenibacillus sp. NPDC058071 TaxID=3346326 RepID=UPI0036DD81C7